MKLVLIVIFIGAIVHKVTSSCYACKYGTAPNHCTDPFVPDGPESSACATINQALCKKYGDYQIACTSGFTVITCGKQGLCGGGSKVTPGPVLLVAVLGVLVFSRSMH